MRQHYSARFLSFCSLLIVCSLHALNADAQTTVQIGLGNSIPTGPLFSPIYRSSATQPAGSRGNILLTKDEMVKAGIPNGAVITAIEFNKTNAANFGIPAPLHEMFIANSTKTALTTTTSWVSIAGSSGTHTKVYSATNFNLPAQPGWVTWTLSSPFTYTGNGLEIAHYTTMSTAAGSGTDVFYWEYTDTIPADRAIGIANTTAANLNGSGVSTKRRPNIRITFSAPPCSGTPVPGKVVAPSNVDCEGSSVNLSLTGNSVGNGISFQWQTAAVPEGPYSNIGPAASNSILLMNAVAGQNYYRAAVTCSGNTSYSDTVRITTARRQLLTGNYTINSSNATAGNNFASFKDAVAAMACGITGPVVFDVTTNTATYNEQVIIPEIPNTSTVNTVTFNANNNILSFVSSNTDERAVLKLNGADHVIFNNLVITTTASTTTQYGYGIQLINKADSNVFRGCKINIPLTANSSTAHNGIVINTSATSATSTTGGALPCSGNLFENNIITGGYYSATLVGGGTTAANTMSGNRFLNNVFKDFYTYGLYISNALDVIVEGNSFTRPDRTNVSSFYGISIGSGTLNARVFKNKLFNTSGSHRTSTGGVYSIYVSAAANANQPNLIYNNLLYGFNGAGPVNAFYIIGATHAKFYHNTADIRNPANTSTATTRGVYQSGGGTGVEFKNNIISIVRGGGGANYAIYLDASSPVVSGYNNLFMEAAGNNLIGYMGGSFASLKEWQDETRKDSFSISADPLFTDVNAGDLTPGNMFAWDNLGDRLNILTDFNGAGRSPVVPDLGAYENTIPVCVSPPVAGRIAGPSDVRKAVQFSLTLKGLSSGIGQTYQWQVSADQSVFTDINGATDLTLLASQTQDSLYYRCIVYCGSTSSASDTVMLRATINYCSAIPSSTANTEIYSVSLNGSVNVSDCTTPAPGQGSIAGRYANYHPRGIFTRITQGATVPFSIVHEDCTPATYSDAAAAIFIDLNGDGDFNDPDEKMFGEDVVITGPRTITGTVTLPLSAKPGITGMRIILAEGAAYAGNNLIPCLSYSSGETEDYIILIEEAADCSGTPVAGTAISSKHYVCPAESFVLRASGTTLAKGLTFQWQSSTDNITWTNVPAATAERFDISQQVTTYYRYILTCTNSGNNSASVPVIVSTPAGAVSGTFTINSAAATAGNNFQTFNDAYDYIKCGINGAVVFNVVPGSGPYIEQLVMSQVPGASAQNTITFNGNGATISYRSVNTNERAVIKLNGTDHVIIDSLQIIATGASTSEYGFGIQLINNADSNIVRKCVVTTSMSSTSTTNYAGIVINGLATSPTSGTNSLCDFNLIEGNTVKGGYYGIALAGSTSNYINANRILKNDIRDFHYGGIYMIYTDGTLIEANAISRPTRFQLGLFTGVRFGGANQGAVINRNRIFNTFGGNRSAAGDQYAVYISSSDATSQKPIIVSNNLVYDFNGVGDIEAFYNSGSDSVRYYNNTISLDNSSNLSDNKTNGFYQTTAATGIEFRNNIITILRGGGGTNHAIFLNTATSTFKIDNNNYLLADSATNFIGRFNAVDYKEMDEWQAGAGLDSNSVNFVPDYQDVSAGDYRPLNGSLDNLGIPVGVGVDIDNAARSVITPDMGAYEFTSVPCTNPPVPGTVITTLNPACLGRDFTLSIDGGLTGTGQSYQWQSSADNTNWVNIAGARARSLTTTQVASTYYRIVYTCATSVPSASIFITTPTLVSGNFTIDRNRTTGNGNFQSFNDAYNFLKCGINGPVVFDVARNSGVYNEQLIMDHIPGTSVTNTVTFKGNGNTIRFASSNGDERAVIKLKSTRHVIIDSLIIDARNGEFGYGVQLTNNTDSNTVRKCTINVSSTLPTTDHSGIVISGSANDPIATGFVLSDDNNFEYNRINGGYYGITLTATFVGGANGRNRFKGNVINDFYSTGIYVMGSYGTIIDSNIISRPNRSSVTEFRGIYFVTQRSTGCQVTRNRIFEPYSGALESTEAFYGIFFSSVDAATGEPVYNENTVSNNLIYHINGEGPSYGIANTGSNYAHYYHNTVVMDNPSETTTALVRGFYQTTSASGIILGNNLISVTAAGSGPKHAIYLNTNLPLAMDFNNYYVNAGGTQNFVGYYGGNTARLSDWRSAVSNGMESFSVSTTPSFVNPDEGDYTPGNAGFNNKGAFVGTTIDILNKIRNGSTPDIGAYEFTPPACSTPAVNGRLLMAPQSICQHQPVLLSMNIPAYGEGQTFQWQVATTKDGVYRNMGNAKFIADTTIIADTTLFYRVAASCGTSTVYSDTVLLSVNLSMKGGTYTINKNNNTNYVPGVTGGNFKSFADVKASLGCGVTGPIIFDVVSASGPYQEKLLLDSIPGVNAVNTITFRGNGNTITANSTTSADRAVITLNGADHITFENFVIDAGTGTYGYGVQLINNADSNVFRNNRILSSLTANNFNYAGVVINSSRTSATTTGETLCDYNRFENNIISGGSYGVTIVGSATADVVDYLKENKFIDNTIQDFYNYGFYIAGTVNTVIQGNTIQRPGRTVNAAALYGIYLTASPSNRLMINKNKFLNFMGGTPARTDACYAIYHNSVDATTGNEDTVMNNLVYNMGGNGPVYGFYNAGSNNVYYYHNTIALDNKAPSSDTLTVGFYQTTLATGLRFINNVITVTREGKGRNFAIFRNTATSEIESDRNNYYVTGVKGYTGYSNAGVRRTLGELITASGRDSNSVAYNPLYVDSAAGNFRPRIAVIDNMGARLGVGEDIEGEVRSLSSPDIGAYEYVPAACASPLIAGTAEANPATSLCLEKPVQLNISGHSPLGSTMFQWETSADGTTGWTPVGAIRYHPLYDTISTIKAYYRAKVSCDASSVYTNIVQVSLSTILPGGTYTIDNSNPTTYVGGITGGNFHSFTEAVSAMTCGIAGKVTFNVLPGTNGNYNEQINIPYIPGTSQEATITFKSENGVPGSVNLSFAGTSAAPYTLRLDSTKNIIFKAMTFTGLDASNARVIEIVNGAFSDSILNSVITVAAVPSASANTAGIYATGQNNKNLVLANNQVNKGKYGIYLAGNAANALTPIGHKIENNRIAGTSGNAIHVQFANSVSILNNTVEIGVGSGGNASGIFTNYADSATLIRGNFVTIQDADTTVYGIYMANTRGVRSGDSAVIAGNRILAATGNADTLCGIIVNASKAVYVLNNVVAINNSGGVAAGIYNNFNLSDVFYYNNSVNIKGTSDRTYAGWFVQQASGAVQLRNNIFSNKAGGKAIFVNDPILFFSDYNMLYTSGSRLVEVATGSVTNFAHINEWRNTWNWDHSSISYEPVFEDDNTLRPDLNNPNVWAMHGRGTQVKGNTVDFSGQSRIDDVTKGVPDLGAYEFYPSVLPTVLQGSPAIPAPNTTQIFTYGSDTVMRIQWQNTVPAGITVRRFSGVAPKNLPAGSDSMFFYTQVDVNGNNDHLFNARLYYVDSWQGTVPVLNRLGLGRTTESNAWVVGNNSTTSTRLREIMQEGIIYMDKFTGLTNLYSQVISEDSNSNRGKDFWVGYQRSWGFGSNPENAANGGSQVMRLYLGAGDVPAEVKVSIEGTNGTPWTRDYYVPANSAIMSDEIPKTLLDDARLVTEGLYQKKGIHVTSNVPVVAYAHVYQSTNSGATMLMPTAVWGYEYYTMGSRQVYSSSNAAFHVVAQHDDTWVEINPSKPTIGGWIPNGGTQPNGSYLVKLNKGDAYQVLGAIIGGSGSEGEDLTGSYIKSIGNASGQCYPIAAFAGSTRTALGCGNTPGGSGDYILQQIFPYQAWGTKYATAPNSEISGPLASTLMNNLFRIMVKDPTTVVKRNNVVLPASTLIGGRYYQYESNQADYIEADKPVMVSQYMTSQSTCGTSSSLVRDPEMFYISPLQQAIRKTQFYRNDLSNIRNNFITFVIPKSGLATLKIDNVSYTGYPAAELYVYDHPNLSGYSVVTKKWGEGAGSSVVESDMPFTGMVYGLGSQESYGYNIGTLVRTLNTLSSVNTTFNTDANPTDYTCTNAPFTMKVMLPVEATRLEWQFSKVPKLSPGVDSVQVNPTSLETVVVNGQTYYVYTVKQEFRLDTVGLIRVPIAYSSPLIEKCTGVENGFVVVQILPAPVTDFQITLPGGGSDACAGANGSFTGDLVTSNGIALNQWQWTFPGNTNVTGRTQSFSFPAAGTFPVRLRGTTPDGCLSDTTKEVIIHPRPLVTITNDSIPTCPDTPVTFSVSAPEAGITYNWYDAATGGTQVGTGISYTASAATLPATYYVEGVSTETCASVTRKKVTLYSVPVLDQPVVTVETTPTTATFTWTAVTNASAYEVSLDGGTTFITPSSGSNGLTHVITGLAPFTDVTLIVRATGITACQIRNSELARGRTVSDEVFAGNAFTPNGDNKNDEFKIYGYTIKEMKFTVFNQWGEKMVETVNPPMDATGGYTVWDGKYKGQMQPSGVYIYVAQILLQNGTSMTKKGSINLIR